MKPALKKLYFTALEVLERTGVSVAQKETCELLNDAGAKVEDEVAYVPAWLVEKAVNSAPKQIIISNRVWRVRWIWW